MQRKKRKSKYVPLSSARQQALELQLNSRADYIEWHKKTNCQYLPRYPERVYKDWVSWNDYLGTANIFKGEMMKPAREFFAAVKWAQAHADLHKLETAHDWHDWIKEHKEELPSDIPVHPEAKYADQWKDIGGWKGWLGVDVRARLAAAKKSTTLLCLCSHHNLRMPGNKFAVIQAEGGENELRQRLESQRDLRVVRCWKMDNELKEQVLETFKRWGRQDDADWFIPVVSNLIWELDQLLELYRGPNKVA